MDVVSNPRISSGDASSSGLGSADDIPGLDEKNEAIHVWMNGGSFMRPTGLSQGGATASGSDAAIAGSTADTRGAVSGSESLGANHPQGIAFRVGTVARPDAGATAGVAGGAVTGGALAGGAMTSGAAFRPVSTSFLPTSSRASTADTASSASSDTSDTDSIMSDDSASSASSQSSVDSAPPEIKDGLLNPDYITYEAAHASTATSGTTTGTDGASTSGAPPKIEDGLLNPDYVSYEAAQSSASTTSTTSTTAAADTGDTSSTDGADTSTANAMPSATDVRPSGDTRSADDIVNANPTLKNMGNQESILTNLKKQCGDWTDPSLTPDQRADAAYRASEVVNYVKSSAAADGTARSTDVTEDGKIDGFTSSGQARHGTEAGIMKDFGEKGYSSLPSDHRLPTTTDKYVNKDGTTKSNAKVIGETIAKALLSVVKAVMNIVSQVLSVVADLKIPGLSQLAAAASVGAEAVSGAANIGVTALNGGDVKKAAEQMGIDVAEQAVSSLTVPGAGKALGKGIEAGVEAGETTASTAQRAAKSGAEQVAGDVYGQYAPSNTSIAS